MNKKVLLSFLIIFCALFLFACSEGNNDTADDASEPEKYEEHLIYQNEIEIYGKLYKPENFSEDDNYPIIIMSHSANVNSETLNLYAERSSALGYLAYTFDFPGSGNSSRSTNIDLCTIFTEIDTLSFIVDYFTEIPYVNGIYLFGTSQGGLVSAVVADEKEELISGLIMFYPAFNVPETILKYPLLSDGRYVEQLKGYDVYEHIGKFKKDVLIVHGTADFIVPCAYSERADELYEKSTLYLVKGANHGFNKENKYFNDDYDEITWSYVSVYLQKHFFD